MLLPEYNNIFKNLNTRFDAACKQYELVAAEDSIWASRNELQDEIPYQGFKLHISATFPEATEVLEKCCAYLIARNTHFKTVKSLIELKKLNGGLHYGYSQIGKMMTIYPRTDAEALELAKALDELTAGNIPVQIPFDKQLKYGSNVFYRYGQFRANPDAKEKNHIKDADGNEVPDLRSYGHAVPSWVTDPFEAIRDDSKTAPKANFKKYLVFDVLARRGKGGVYRALDVFSSPARECIMKEGKKYGEIDLDARDGYWRAEQEEKVLRALHAEGVLVPEPYDGFAADGNFYLIQEKIEGPSLYEFMHKRRRKKLSLAEFKNIALQAVEILAGIHNNGWVWRDCKPMNFIMENKARLRPIDFEGAVRIGEYDPYPWGSPGYMAPEVNRLDEGLVHPAIDLFSLGGLFFFLVTGKHMMKEEDKNMLHKCRRHYPKEVKKMILKLMAEKPEERASLEEVKTLLEK